MLLGALHKIVKILVNHCLVTLPGDGMAEALKNSPHNGRGTPRDDIPPGGAPGDMVPYNLQYQDNVSKRGRAPI